MDNPFHQSENGCQFLKDVHVYNSIDYTQDHQGNVDNWKLMDNCEPELVRHKELLSGTLYSRSFDATNFFSFAEIMQKLPLNNKDVFRATWQHFISTIFGLNKTHESTQIDLNGNSCTYLINPKNLFDVYIERGATNNIYMFRPILMQCADSAYFEHMRDIIVLFFEMIGKGARNLFTEEMLSSTWLKNKKSNCQLLENHYNHRLHLRQLKCKGFRANNRLNKLRDKSNTDNNRMINLSQHHEQHFCWKRFETDFLNYATSKSSTLSAPTANTSDAKASQSIAINKCLITPNIYIGYSLLYRNDKMHTLLCTPSFFLNWEWYKEIVDSLSTAVS